jgi:hypothetical protein
MSARCANVSTLDPVNAAMLPIMRHHLTALQGDDPLAWRHAFHVAVERWGEGRGLALAHRAQVFLSALLACRLVPLNIADPLDLDRRVFLTDDEQHLMVLLSAMREDDAPCARDLLSLLSGGRVTAAIVQAGLSFASLMETPQIKIRKPAPPKLRPVS